MRFLLKMSVFALRLKFYDENFIFKSHFFPADPALHGTNVVGVSVINRADAILHLEEGPLAGTRHREVNVALLRLHRAPIAGARHREVDATLRHLLQDLIGAARHLEVDAAPHHDLCPALRLALIAEARLPRGLLGEGRKRVGPPRPRRGPAGLAHRKEKFVTRTASNNDF